MVSARRRASATAARRASSPAAASSARRNRTPSSPVAPASSPASSTRPTASRSRIVAAIRFVTVNPVRIIRVPSCSQFGERSRPAVRRSAAATPASRSAASTAAAIPAAVARAAAALGARPPRRRSRRRRRRPASPGRCRSTVTVGRSSSPCGASRIPAWTGGVSCLRVAGRGGRPATRLQAARGADRRVRQHPTGRLTPCARARVGSSCPPLVVARPRPRWSSRRTAGPSSTHDPRRPSSAPSSSRSCSRSCVVLTAGAGLAGIVAVTSITALSADLPDPEDLRELSFDQPTIVYDRYRQDRARPVPAEQRTGRRLSTTSRRSCWTRRPPRRTARSGRTRASTPGDGRAPRSKRSTATGAAPRRSPSSSCARGCCPTDVVAPGADLYLRKAKEVIQSARLTAGVPGRDGQAADHHRVPQRDLLRPRRVRDRGRRGRLLRRHRPREADAGPGRAARRRCPSRRRRSTRTGSRRRTRTAASSCPRTRRRSSAATGSSRTCTRAAGRS